MSYETSCARREALEELFVGLGKRLADTAQRLKDLHHVQKVLKTSLQLCREAEASGRCHVIDDLTEVSSTHT